MFDSANIGIKFESTKEKATYSQKEINLFLAMFAAVNESFPVNEKMVE